MTTTPIDTVLLEFRQDVQRATQLLELIKAFRNFGASSPTDEVKASWLEASELRELAQNRRTDVPVLSGSLLLYLAGRFEYCFKKLIECVADEVVERHGAYEKLPEKLRAELRSKVLEVSTAPRKYGFDERETNAFLRSLVENIAPEPPGSASASSAISIPTEVLSITESNMKDRVVAELAKRVGMDSFWQELGRQAQMKIFLNTATDGQTTSESITRLNAIMDERNQIAHPTSATAFPDPDKVLASAAFLSELASVSGLLAKAFCNGLPKPEG